MTAITTKKLNDIKIHPVRIQQPDTDEIKGKDYLPTLYNNSLIIAKKNSGKTMMIAQLLRETIDDRTNVVVFSGTSSADPVWLEIKKDLNKRNINAEFHLDIIENGINIIQAYIEAFQEMADEEQQPEEPITEEPELFLKVKVRKERKRKYIVPRWLFVFDDISKALSNRYVAILTKMHRHFMCRVIISTQYAHDIDRDTLIQMDYVFLFRMIEVDKLKIFHERLALWKNYTDFEKIYKFATEEKYSFLMIDRVNGVFRRNFSDQILF
jgi:hypothetical protein